MYLEELWHEMMANMYKCACELAERSPIKRGLCVCESASFRDCAKPDFFIPQNVIAQVAFYHGLFERKYKYIVPCYKPNFKLY